MHRIGIVGFGAIASGEHLPCILADPDFDLVAIASPGPSPPVGGAPHFASLETMLAGTQVDAVALCTPPWVRHRIALAAIAAGKSVLMEKPPAATMGAAIEMVTAAKQRGVVLFATWHSQYNAAVDRAREILADDPPCANHGDFRHRYLPTA